MEWLKIAFMIAFGIGAGTITAGGFFSVVTSVGIYNRIAAVTHTTDKIKWYEEVIIAGATAGNVIWIFDIHVPLGIVGTTIYGLISGVFIGLFAVCLAETIKALPIFVRRIRIGTGIGLVVLAIAFGKAVGHLLYYLKMYC